jgi:hypothetical protein
MQTPRALALGYSVIGCPSLEFLAWRDAATKSATLGGGVYVIAVSPTERQVPTFYEKSAETLVIVAAGLTFS